MKFIYLIFLFLFVGCTSIKSRVVDNDKKRAEDWYEKDFATTDVPGISLEKFILTNNKSLKKNRTIIVAVLDTQIDDTHEDLKEAIWVNSKEIPNNGIDDDNNGYVDDVKGWNFLGFKSGGYSVWANFEYTRIVREYATVFKEKKREEIPTSELFKFNEYQRALKYQTKWFQYYNNYSKSLKYSLEIYPLAKDTLKYFFPKENYTVKQLDSMYLKYKINDKTFKQRRDSGDRDLGALIDEMKSDIELNTNSFDKINDQKIQMDSIVNKNLNINYNDRESIGDNERILETGYGNGKVNNKVQGIRRLYGHSTKVSSIIAATRKNNIGIKGFSDNIKIMPLSISPSGDELDKDIVMAIKYAVDNGAKIINMSFTKEFSLHPEWLKQALQYAEKHNVLVVHISGNDGLDIDKAPTYPNDYDYDGQPEFCSNFINVGSISRKMDSSFVSNFSNYGKKNVDLFAPGEEIYTAIPENKYEFDSGTSLAGPMVSGTAALIWLYYPDLPVQEVKRIILDSSTKYDIDIIVPGTKDKKEKFSELSKSGGVLNVYNALEMAKKWHSK